LLSPLHGKSDPEQVTLALVTMQPASCEQLAKLFSSEHCGPKQPSSPTWQPCDTQVGKSVPKAAQSSVGVPPHVVCVSPVQPGTPKQLHVGFEPEHCEHDATVAVPAQ